MNYDISIKNLETLYDSLNTVTSVESQFKSLYSSISTAYNAINQVWQTEGTDVSSLKQSLNNNIQKMTGEVIPQLNTYNKIITELINRYKEIGL